MAAAEPTGRVNSLRAETTRAPTAETTPTTPPEESDRELVARLRDADGTALAMLYDRYAPAVHGLTRAILRDDRLAEEATHDVFLGVWQDPNAYQPTRGVFA